MGIDATVTGLISSQKQPIYSQEDFIDITALSGKIGNGRFQTKLKLHT